MFRWGHQDDELVMVRQGFPPQAVTAEVSKMGGRV